MAEEQSSQSVADDRISSLPDELLHHILSHLDAIYVAQTSLLSRRWRHVFATMPFLNFDFYTYCRNYLPPYRKTASFTSFVDAFLLSHRSNLLKFTFSSLELLEPEAIRSFLSHAASRNVQHLELTVYASRFELPACLYANHSLKVLKLNSSFIDLSREFGFPALKELRLENFWFSKQRYNSGEIFSKCPNLESLTLINCHISSTMEYLEISSPRLKKLELMDFSGLGYGNVAISAPRLACFKFRGTVPLLCYLRDVSSLDEAKIGLYGDEDAAFEAATGLSEVDEFLRGLKRPSSLSLIRMVRAFSNAKHVYVSEKAYEILRQDPNLVRELDGTELEEEGSKWYKLGSKSRNLIRTTLGENSETAEYRM
ncbi:hypothetical protein Ancab_033036 [Ancistrocladus abbreviatus]